LRLLLGDGKERILETVGRRGLFDAGLKGGNGLLDGGRVEGVGGLCGSGCAIRRYSWKLLLLLRLLLLLHHVVVHGCAGLGCVWGIVMRAQWRGAARSFSWPVVPVLAMLLLLLLLTRPMTDQRARRTEQATFDTNDVRFNDGRPETFRGVLTHLASKLQSGRPEVTSKQQVRIV
jgi:hypothetical protein